LEKNNVDSKQIYLLNAAINITGTTSVAKAAVTGDQLNTDYYKFTRQTTQPNMRRADAEKRFIKNNPDSYVSLDQALKDLSRGYANADSLEPVYEMLSAHIRSTPAGIAYRKYLDNLSTTAIGKIAPDFSQADTSGMPVKLSDFRGKYVLIDFWASWCHPCRMANPALVKTYAKYNNQNFMIIGVSLDVPGAKSAWLKAIHHDGISWLQLSDLQGWKNEIAQLYSVHAIPQNFLIDPTGKIIDKDLFNDELDKRLDGIFDGINKSASQ
jgi:peroxiredoxin